MIATLSFNLPEEQEEFKIATQAQDASIALYKFDQYLRARLKYEELSDEVHAALEHARERLREECLSRNVNTL